MLNRGDAETQRENQLTEKIIGCGIEVHKALGPGLLESASVGLLINFNVPVLKQGITRLVNRFQEASAS
jgi:hypothetical protein